MWQPSRSDNYNIGVFIEDVVGFSQGVKVELYIVFAALGHAPVDDRNHFTPTLALHGQANLSARVSGSLKNSNRVTAFGGNTRCFKPGRSSPDDYYLFSLICSRDVMRHGEFTARGGIVHTQRVTTLINTVEAVGRTDTGTDIVFPTLDNFSHDMRVSHVCPCHTDHVNKAGSDGVTRCSNIGDASSVESRHACGLAHFAGKVQERRASHTLHRNYISQPRVCVDMTADNIEKIDHTRVF